MTQPQNALHKESDSDDYVLSSDSVWISAGRFSVFLKKTDEGVCVDLYAKGHENVGALAATWALDSEIDILEDEA